MTGISSLGIQSLEEWRALHPIDSSPGKLATGYYLLTGKLEFPGKKPHFTLSSAKADGNSFTVRVHHAGGTVSGNCRLFLRRIGFSNPSQGELEGIILEYGNLTPAGQVGISLKNLYGGTDRIVNYLRITEGLFPFEALINGGFVKQLIR